MNNFIKENNIQTIQFLYNNSYFFENHIICGTRGWNDSNNEEDIKILRREYLRLELSIKDGIKKYGNDKPIIVCMHYPPFFENENKNIQTDVDFIKLMGEYNVTNCIYGHIHGKEDKEIKHFENSNIEYKLVSCDYLNFKLFKIK